MIDKSFRVRICQLLKHLQCRIVILVFQMPLAFLQGLGRNPLDETHKNQDYTNAVFHKYIDFIENVGKNKIFHGIHFLNSEIIKS